MLFCPICGNILVVASTADNFQFFCNTCTYFYPVKEKISLKSEFETKKVDDILGGAAAWENVD